MKLKLTVLLLTGLLLNACGDKTASSSGRKIFAVRSLEDNGQTSNGENIQVALLDANQIDSEEDAQRAVQNAQWVPIDDFSNNNNIVFREDDDEGPKLESVTYAGYRNYHRRPRGCNYTRSHRHRRGCWRPYSRSHWVNRRPPIAYRGCRRGYLYRRGRCVLPYTAAYNYWWTPRHTYYTRVDVSWNNHRRSSRRRHHRRPHRRWRNNGRFRVSLYF